MKEIGNSNCDKAYIVKKKLKNLKIMIKKIKQDRTQKLQ